MLMRMAIRSPWDNLISRHDDSLLAQLARQEVDTLTGLSRQHGATPRPPRPESPDESTPTATPIELASAQEVTFAEVLQELQSHIQPPRSADDLPNWAKLNIQNAPPVVVKLLGMKT